MTDTIDDRIRRTAIERFGATDVSVRTWDDRPAIMQGIQGESREWNGRWFALSVTIGDESKFIGRRRTKAELLKLVSTLAPEHVDGKNFGRCTHAEDWN